MQFESFCTNIGLLFLIDPHSVYTPLLPPNEASFLVFAVCFCLVVILYGRHKCQFAFDSYSSSRTRESATQRSSDCIRNLDTGKASGRCSLEQPPAVPLEKHVLIDFLQWVGRIGKPQRGMLTPSDACASLRHLNGQMVCRCMNSVRQNNIHARYPIDVRGSRPSEPAGDNNQLIQEAVWLNPI